MYLQKWLLVLLLCVVHTLQAQTTEQREKMFRIAYVKALNKDSVLAYIPWGKKQGISTGSTGPVNGTYSKTDDRSDMELGFGSVYVLTDTSAVLLIRPKATGGKPTIDIRVGDYVKLSIQVPKLQYRSIFFELALLDIDFIDNNREAMYDFDALLYLDSKELEDSLLQHASRDVVDTYEFLKDQTENDFSDLKKPLASGRYSHRSVFEVMAACNRKDILSFLHFVKSYPGKYIGTSWKINETFATWVLNNAPYSKVEVYDSIVAYQSKPAMLKRFIILNRALLIKDKYILDWGDEALEAYEQKDISKADALFAMMKKILPYLSDPCNNGAYYYKYAQYFQYKALYKQALPFCDSAAFYYKTCGDYDFYTESHFKKAYCLRMLKRYDEALAVYANIENILWKSSFTHALKDTAYLQAKYYREAGYTWENKGEFLKAIPLYTKAINAFKAMNNYNSLQNAISVQYTVAGIYTKQGEYAKALAIYEEQLLLYQKLNDKKNEASVIDNIGYVQSRRGNYRLALEQHAIARSYHLFVEDYNSAGYAQSQMGQCYWNLGLYDSAIAAHEQAIWYRKQAGSYSGQAYSWRKLGSLYTLAGNKVKALAAYDSTAYYYALAKDSTSLIENLLDVGDVYKNDQQYQKAFAYYRQAHLLNIAKGNKSDIVNSHFKLGDAAYKFDTTLSRIHFDSCYTLAIAIGDKSNALYAGLNLGLLSFRAYDYVTGEKHFQKSLSIAISEKSKTEEAYCYEQMAAANATKLDFTKAIDYYERAIHMYDSLGDKSKLPSLYSGLANTYSTKGDFQKAIGLYRQAKQLATAINSKADVGYALGAMSFIYVLQGDIANAAINADSSLLVFTALNNTWQMANSYVNLGIVANMKNDYTQAVQYYLQADSIFILEKDDWGRSTCQNNIGNVYFYQADYNKALAYFFTAERLLSTMKVITESHILGKLNIGEVYYHQQDYTNAEKYLQEGYAKAKAKKAGRMLNSANLLLGKLYYDLHKTTLAEKHLQEAYTIALQRGESDQAVEAGLYFGRLYATGNAAKSIDYLNSSVVIGKRTGSSKFYWQALYQLGLNFYNTQRFDSATYYFKLAVQDVEKAAEKLFGGAEAKKIYNADYRKVDLYNKLVACLVKTGHADDALYYADKSNNQAVKEQVSRVGVQTNDAAKADALKKGDELLQKKTAVAEAIAKEKAKPEKDQNKQLIASLESIKNIAEEDYTNFIEQLQRSYPDMQAYFSNTNPKDFKNYIEDIPDSTIVVLYMINDNQLYIFTVTGKGTAIKAIELKQDINKQAARFLAVLRNPNNATGTGAVVLRSTLKPVDDVRGDFKTEAAALYSLLITPIEDQLKDKKNICIIPNGKLSSIPFQCLGYNNDKGFHFLVQDYALFYTSKIDIFRKNFKARPMQSSLAVLGNPDKSLPGATTEAREIGKLIPTATVYIEDNATEGKAKESLQKYNYVHFATHGILDYTNFDESYLLFTKDDGQGNDGRLTIKEINGLTKQTNSMVVLSACETAVNKEEVKGWYISPANAFLTNRVDAVLGSLWKVPDETTNLLLQEFYTNIENKHMTKAEALRHAQATISQNPKYHHPFYWSAFVLYGEWR